MPPKMQGYPRKDNFLAEDEIFPIQNPPLPLETIHNAIKAAFIRAGKKKSGDSRKVTKTPEELAKKCLQHGAIYIPNSGKPQPKRRLWNSNDSKNTIKKNNCFN